MEVRRQPEQKAHVKGMGNLSRYTLQSVSNSMQYKYLLLYCTGDLKLCARTRNRHESSVDQNLDFAQLPPWAKRPHIGEPGESELLRESGPASERVPPGGVTRVCRNDRVATKNAAFVFKRQGS